jgi:hypothetical protein
MPEVTNLRAGVFSMINSRSGAMKLSYLYPLFGFILPTAIVGYGFVIPKSCIAGINDLTIGYTVTLISAGVTYWIGLRNVLRDVASSSGGKHEPPEVRVRIILQKEEKPLPPS